MGKFSFLGWFLAFVFLGPETRGDERIFKNRAYGTHERQIFDLWSPSSKAPLVVYIHGGGWVAGSKEDLSGSPGLIRRFLRAGFAVSSLNYRFLKHAPLQTILREDIAGFVQYVRFHAKELGVDPLRVFAYGPSAGGSASLWLASHDDLADLSTEDEMRRESTRISAAGHMNAQVSYDFLRWYQFFGKERTDRFMKDQVWRRYHFHSLEDLETPKGSTVRAEVDMYGNLSADDPPMLFWNSLKDEIDRDYNHFVHSPRHARILSERARELGILTEVQIQADGSGHLNSHDAALQFFLRVLKEP